MGPNYKMSYLRGETTEKTEKIKEKNLNKNKTNTDEISKEKANISGVAGENPFQSSAKVRRSPQTRVETILQAPKRLPTTSKSTTNSLDCDEGTPRSTNQDRLRGTAAAASTTTDRSVARTSSSSSSEINPSRGSPREELISRMRQSEEQTIERCRKTLKKIRQAINRQKNISMDVQNGVVELEELLDILGDYRRTWKSAEAANKKEKPITEAPKTALIPTVCQREGPLIQKRTANSPAEKPTPLKKRKGISQKTDPKAVKEPKRKPDSNSKKVQTDQRKEKPPDRKETRKKMPKPRSTAVVVKPAEGHTYADVLKQLKDKVKPEDADITVRSIRKTKAGAILLQLGQGGNVQKFSETIRTSLKDDADVRKLESRATIEIRDIDCTSTEQDVRTAVCVKTGASEGDISTRLTKLNSRDQRRAFVVLPTKAAIALLKTERIKIGWTNCRIKHCEDTKRCYKCFGLGHGQWECKGPDRKSKGICIRCGKEGHILKQCQNPPDCCLCTEQGISPTNHLPGSRGCKANRQK